jgi:hypothetical protein
VKFIQYLTLCGLKPNEIEPLLAMHHTPENGFHHADFADGQLDDLVALIIHETTASIIDEYECVVIPGLLQSRDYARALFDECDIESKDVLDTAAQRRLDRQSVLNDQLAAQSTFFISEGVLRSAVGDRQVMHDQMLKLCLMCSRFPKLIRVVSAIDYGRTGAPSSFRVMRFVDHAPVATQDLLTGMVFLEKLADLAVYRNSLERLDQVALSPGQSQALIASLADDYGRAEAGLDDRATGIMAPQ